MESTEKQLTDNEAAAYEIIHSDNEMSYLTTDDINAIIAEELEITVNQSKGILGSLCKKGYLKKHKQVVNGQTYYQFSLPLEN